MAQFVLTIKEEICTAHGKDVKATELLKVMAHYGLVEDYNTVIERETAPLKATINDLVKQNEAIKEFALDDFDLTILRAARQAMSKELDGKDVQISALTQELKKVVDFHEKKHQELTAFVTAFTEKYTENYAEQ